MSKKQFVLEISLVDEPVIGSDTGETQLRVVTDTENGRYDRGIDFDDGYKQAGEDVQEVILGWIARYDWEREIKTLYS